MTVLLTGEGCSPSASSSSTYVRADLVGPPSVGPSSVRQNIKNLDADYEKSENDIKALQSVGQIVGEVTRQLDEERCESSFSFGKGACACAQPRTALDVGDQDEKGATWREEDRIRCSLALFH